MYFKKITPILLVILAISCSSDKEEKSRPVSNLDEFKSYTINMEAPQVKFTDLVDEVEIFRMEETDESLLGNVYHATLYNDLLVFPDNTEQSLYFFNTQGDFLRKVNRKGDGPEEYSSLWSFWIKRDTLKIYDNQRQRLIYYSMAGDYFGELKVPARANHVYENERGYWLDLSNRLSGDSTSYELVGYDHQMENPIQFLPYNKSKGFPISATINSMKRYGDMMLYKQTLSDTVYVIDEDKIEPLVHLNFGDDFLWNDQELIDNPEGGMKAIQEANKVWIVWPYVGSEQIYLTYNSSFQDSYQVLLNRSSGKHVKIDTRKNAGEKYGLMFNGWVGDQMLVAVNSLDLAELLAELEEGQYSFEEGSSLDIIESSENPAMMWVKFKDGI